MLFRAPHKLLGVALLILLLCAVIEPKTMAWVFVLTVAACAFVRWQTWQAESVILTGARIIRVQGVPETTSTEASLRIDRISGARLIETVPGKIFGYGTIELEAPGDHPDVRRLKRIAHPHEFYLALRHVIFGDPNAVDPDDGLGPSDYITAPLPALPGRRARFGRHRG